MGMFDYGINAYKFIQKIGDLIVRARTWSTNYSLPKESPLSGETQLVVPAASAYEVKTIPHNLGYMPTFKIYYDNNNGVWHELGSVSSFAGPTYQFAMAYSDSNNLYLHGTNGSGTDVTYNIRFFIFLREIQ